MFFLKGKLVTLYNLRRGKQIRLKLFPRRWLPQMFVPESQIDGTTNGQPPSSRSILKNVLLWMQQYVRTPHRKRSRSGLKSAQKLSIGVGWGWSGGSVGGTRDQRAACWINLRRGAEIKPVEWDCLANTIMANTYLGWTSAQWASIYHLLPPRAITDATFHTIHYKRLSSAFALFYFIFCDSDDGIFLWYEERFSSLI